MNGFFCFCRSRKCHRRRSCFQKRYFPRIQEDLSFHEPAFAFCMQRGLRTPSHSLKESNGNRYLMFSKLKLEPGYDAKRIPVCLARSFLAKSEGNLGNQSSGFIFTLTGREKGRLEEFHDFFFLLAYLFSFSR